MLDDDESRPRTRVNRKAKTLSSRAEILLGIVREATIWDAGVLRRYWMPLNGSRPIMVYGQEFGGSVNGGGDARIFKMLEERGLIREQPTGRYCYAATEDGRVLYEEIAARRGLYKP